MPYMSKEQKILRVISAPVIYFFLAMFVQVVVSVGCFAAGVRATRTEEVGIQHSVGFLDELQKIMEDKSVFMSGCAAVVGIVAFLWAYRKDMKENKKYEERPALEELRGVGVLSHMKYYLIGATAGMALNFFITILPLDGIIGSYEKTSTYLFAGDFVSLFVVMGILVPAVEELVYRGIAYQRLRNDLDVKYAVPISALLFGLFHFNLKQGVFAFAFGCVLALLYEKHKSVTTSMLAHMAVNQITVMLYCTGWDEILGKHIWLYIGVTLLLGAAGMFLIYEMLFQRTKT